MFISFLRKYLVIIVVSLFSTNLFAVDWMNEFQNERNDRKIADIKLPLTVKWKQVSGRIGNSSPIYMEGKIYVLKISERLIFWDRKIYVNEIDKDTGKVKESYSVGTIKWYQYIRMMGYEGRCYISAVRVDEGRQLEDEKLEIFLWAYDIKNKKLLWKWDTSINAYPLPTTHIGAYLIGYDNKLIMTSMEVENQPKFYCFNADTGKLLWETKEPEGFIENTFPVIKDGKLYAATKTGNSTYAGYLAAIDVNSGKILQKRELRGKGENDVWGSEMSCSIVLKGENLYVPLYSFGKSSASVDVYDTNDLTRKYSTSQLFKGSTQGTLLVDEDFMWVVNLDKELLKINNLNGKKIMGKNLDFYDDGLLMQTKDNVCYARKEGRRNYLVFISKETGQESARYELPVPGEVTQQAHITDAVPINGNLLVCFEDSSFYMLEGK